MKMTFYKTLPPQIIEPETSQPNKKPKVLVNVYTNNRRILRYLQKLHFIDNTGFKNKLTSFVSP